ncbi:MAG: hypothetical protein P8Y97_07665, partial [Candidatus Lokiarchaeota archaeon]
MNIHINGILNGSSALGVLIINAIIGVYILIKAYKLGAKLLKYAGFMIILIGLLWSGPSVDFLLILFTGTNITPTWIYAIISYIWVAPAILLAILIGSELIAPKRKKIIISLVIIVGIVFEVGLIFFPFDGLSFNYTLPTPLGSNIIDTSLNYDFFTFYALAIILIFVVIFNGFGSIKKALDSTGILKRKFTYLALAFIIFPIAAVFDTLVSIAILLP